MHVSGPSSPGHRLHRASVPPAAIPSGEDDLRAALAGLVASGQKSLVGVARIYRRWDRGGKVATILGGERLPVHGDGGIVSRVLPSLYVVFDHPEETKWNRERTQILSDFRSSARLFKPLTLLPVEQRKSFFHVKCDAFQYFDL